MKRKLLTLILAGLLCLGLAVPAAAAVEEIAGLRLDEVTGYSQEDGIYTVVKGGLYGFYRVDGSPLLAPAYAAVDDFHNGMAAVSLSGEWIAVRGESGLAEVFRGGRFGYVDADGALIIPMQYRRAFPFSEGRAFAVDGEGTLVLLDRTGRELASFPKAELLEDESIRFSEGLAVIPVRSADTEEDEELPELTYLVVNAAGEEVCTLTDAYADFANGYRDGRIAVAEEGQWTVDEAGLTRQFSAAPGAWNYRDDAGEEAMDSRFDAAGPFSDGLAPVGLEDERGQLRYGFADLDGEMVVPVEYEDVMPYTDGIGAVLLDGRWAYVNQDGRRITGFVYDEAGSFHEGAAMGRAGRELRVINRRGGVLFTAEANRALPFSDGVTVMYRKDGSCGVYDQEGNLLIPFEYERVFHWEGYLWLKRGDLWRVYLTEDVIAASLSAPDGETASIGTFTDVPSDAWYAQAVTWASDHDVITGAGGGQFSPDRPCTIGEVLTFLWRAVGQPEPSAENPFTDVTPNHYYYRAALWAYENSMVPRGTFGAADLCTRGMAVTYLWQLAGYPVGYEGSFYDIGDGSPYRYAVAWATAEGITAGSGSGAFSPNAICSRGQIITFLYRYLADQE